MLTRLLSKSLAFSFPLSILILLLNQSASLASDSDSLFAGQVVRIDYDTSISKRFIYIIPYSLKETNKIIGRIISWDSSLVIISSDSVKGETKEISTTLIKNMYIRDGKKRSVLRGVAYGGSVGLLSGVLIIVGYGHDDDPEKDSWIEQNRGLAAALYVGGSAVIGGVIGWFAKVDRWRKVKRSSWPVELSVDLHENRYGARLAYSF